MIKLMSMKFIVENAPYVLQNCHLHFQLFSIISINVRR